MLFIPQREVEMEMNDDESPEMDEQTLVAPEHDEMDGELDEEGSLGDEVITLPPHSVCVAHRCNNICTTDAGFLLDAVNFQWKKIRAPGRNRNVINTEFDDFGAPLPTTDDLNKYRKAFVEANNKMKKIWTAEGSSSKFLDTFLQVFKK